jgi:hypothetical protein
MKKLFQFALILALSTFCLQILKDAGYWDHQSLKKELSQSDDNDDDQEDENDLELLSTNDFDPIFTSYSKQLSFQSTKNTAYFNYQFALIQATIAPLFFPPEVQ